MNFEPLRGKHANSKPAVSLLMRQYLFAVLITTEEEAKFNYCYHALTGKRCPKQKFSSSGALWVFVHKPESKKEHCGKKQKELIHKGATEL